MRKANLLFTILKYRVGSRTLMTKRKRPIMKRSSFHRVIRSGFPKQDLESIALCEGEDLTLSLLCTSSNHIRIVYNFSFCDWTRRDSKGWLLIKYSFYLFMRSIQ